MLFFIFPGILIKKNVEVSTMARSDFDMDDNNDYENQPNKRRFFGNSSNNNFNGPEIVYDESTENFDRSSGCITAA